MKRQLLMAVALLSIVCTLLSCDKDETQPESNKAARKIQYILYTNEDFGNDNHNITFSLFARDNNRTLLDSAITTMKVKDIPAAADKIIIEKTIVTDAATDLLAGFVYNIEGVGISWHLDSVKAGQHSKTIEYAFK